MFRSVLVLGSLFLSMSAFAGDDAPVTPDVRNYVMVVGGFGAKSETFGCKIEKDGRPLVGKWDRVLKEKTAVQLPVAKPSTRKDAPTLPELDPHLTFLGLSCEKKICTFTGLVPVDQVPTDLKDGECSIKPFTFSGKQAEQLWSAMETFQKDSDNRTVEPFNCVKSMDAATNMSTYRCTTVVKDNIPLYYRVVPLLTATQDSEPWALSIVSAAGFEN